MDYSGRLFLHNGCDPGNKVACTVSSPFCLYMGLVPDGCEFDILYSHVVFKSQGQVDFNRVRCVSLVGQSFFPMIQETIIGQVTEYYVNYQG